MRQLAVSRLGGTYTSKLESRIRWFWRRPPDVIFQFFSFYIWILKRSRSVAMLWFSYATHWSYVKVLCSLVSQLVYIWVQKTLTRCAVFSALRIYALRSCHIPSCLLIFALNLVPVVTNVVRFPKVNARGLWIRLIVIVQLQREHGQSFRLATFKRILHLAEQVIHPNNIQVRGLSSSIIRSDSSASTGVSWPSYCWEDIELTFLTSRLDY